MNHRSHALVLGLAIAMSACGTSSTGDTAEDSASDGSSASTASSTSAGTGGSFGSSSKGFFFCDLTPSCPAVELHTNIWGGVDCAKDLVASGEPGVVLGIVHGTSGPAGYKERHSLFVYLGDGTALVQERWGRCADGGPQCFDAGANPGPVWDPALAVQRCDVMVCGADCTTPWDTVVDCVSAPAPACADVLDALHG